MDLLAGFMPHSKVSPISCLCLDPVIENKSLQIFQVPVSSACGQMGPRDGFPSRTVWDELVVSLPATYALLCFHVLHPRRKPGGGRGTPFSPSKQRDRATLRFHISFQQSFGWGMFLHIPGLEENKNCRFFNAQLLRKLPQSRAHGFCNTQLGLLA